MRGCIRFVSFWMLLVLLVACGSTANQTPTNPPQAAATQTPEPPSTFASGSSIAGIDVSGLTPEEAVEKLKNDLTLLKQPLELKIVDEQLSLTPEQIKLEVPVDELVAAAQSSLQAGQPAEVDLSFSYDQSTVRSELEALALSVATPGVTRLITETDRYSRTFVFEPGLSLDIDAALEQIDQHLQGDQQGTIELELVPDGTPEPVSIAELQSTLETMAERWDGVVGIYLYDLQSGETVAINEDVVFSGASVMKVPIMLQSYISLPELSDEERELMAEMIGKSDNMAANDLLAKVAGGQGTDIALEGVGIMNETLKSLGLEHTYQNLPYEAGEFLINVLGMKIPRGPAEEGVPPFTEADPYVRTTPKEIAQIFIWIYQCSNGEGILLERYGDSLTPERCAEMISWLEQNEDQIRMVAGFPEGTKVAHKSGWVEDMQADAGIVSTPGGDFVVALYFYQQQRNSYLADEYAAPIIAAFARLIYSAYNPTIVTP